MCVMSLSFVGRGMVLVMVIVVMCGGVWVGVGESDEGDDKVGDEVLV